MQESSSLRQRLDRRIGEALSIRGRELDAISPEAGPVLAQLHRLTSGGKRLRARFAIAGWQAFSPPEQPSSASPETALDTADAAPDAAALELGVALELFHAAALVHDDIIDRSDTRRGEPATHRVFQELHRSRSWGGSDEGFGQSAAILLGDLLLGWSDELLDAALGLARSAAVPAERRRTVREQFNRMRSEVILGQYLDVLAEHDWVEHPAEAQYQRALQVARYKSARYSIAFPMLLGGTLAGADETQQRMLEESGQAAGMAFQLRDDLLGVFGSSELTGKPVGDDLREGKRTALIALARERADAQQLSLLDARLGDPALDAQQVAELQTLLQELGAVQALEERIRDYSIQAQQLLDQPQLPQLRLGALRTLIEAAITRQA